MLELNKIYNEDCLEGMKKIDDESIDMILCDLPYGTIACAWDVIIPFEPLWTQYKRVIKPNGAIVLTASQPFTTKLIMSNLEWFKYEWIWLKTAATGFQHAKNMPMKKHENILIFSKGSMGHSSLVTNRMQYNPQDTVLINKISKPGKNKFGGIVGKRPSHKQCYETEYENYPTSVIEFRGDKGLHPTQKPVALFEYLIKTYTNEGETVLDSCMGSGTTAIACINTNRNFIGFELDKEYFDKANKRILHTNKPLF